MKRRNERRSYFISRCLHYKMSLKRWRWGEWRWALERRRVRRLRPGAACWTRWALDPRDCCCCWRWMTMEERSPERHACRRDTRRADGWCTTRSNAHGLHDRIWGSPPNDSNWITVPPFFLFDWLVQITQQHLRIAPLRTNKSGICCWVCSRRTLVCCLRVLASSRSEDMPCTCCSGSNLQSRKIVVGWVSEWWILDRERLKFSRSFSPWRHMPQESQWNSGVLSSSSITTSANVRWNESVSSSLPVLFHILHASQ